MAEPASRYAAPHPFSAAKGWRIERLTPLSRLLDANGLRTGPDGRIYVAQMPGSQVSAIDPDSGAITTTSPMGGAVVAPDHLASGQADRGRMPDGRADHATRSGGRRAAHDR